MDIECVADGQGVESAFATTSPASVQGEDPSSTYSRFWMDVGEKLDNVGDWTMLGKALRRTHAVSSLERVDLLTNDEFDQVLKSSGLRAGFKVTYLEERGLKGLAVPKQINTSAGRGGLKTKNYNQSDPTLSHLPEEDLDRFFASLTADIVQFKTPPVPGVPLNQSQVNPIPPACSALLCICILTSCVCCSAQQCFALVLRTFTRQWAMFTAMRTSSTG
jgi:hypothetical protein